MTTEPRLPQESREQEIGNNADIAFSANRPRLWRPHSLTGTDDVGFDYQVQVVADGLYRGAFRLQLKGTESPELNVSGQYFSVTLKASTLNYYARFTEPILLVLCDLSQHREDPAGAPLYYTWIHEEIRRVFTDTTKLSDTETRTIRVPTANLLTKELDVFPVLEENLRLHVAARAFDHTVERTVPELGALERTQILENVEGQIAHRGKPFIESLSAPISSPWPEAPRNSRPGKLSEAVQKLKTGALESATVLLNQVEPELSAATSLERAEYWFLRGRINTFGLDDQSASEAFDKSVAEQPTVAKYQIGWGEAQLRLNYDPQKPFDLTPIVSRLTSSEPEVTALVARLLAAVGRFSEANDRLVSIEHKHAIGTMAIIAAMRGESDEVIAICDEGLQDQQGTDASRQLFHMLRAKAHFNRALKVDAKKPDNIIPIFGPAGFDPGELQMAWRDMSVATDLMRSAGWPPNVEYLADIWSSTAIILDRHKEALIDIREASRMRPTLNGLARALELVAVHSGKFDLVLQAIERQPKTSETTIRKVAALYQLGKYTDCVDYLDAELPSLPRDHGMLPVSLGLGVMAADKIIRPETAAKFEALLTSNPAWEGEFAVLRYFRTVEQNRLAKDAAISELEKVYEKSGKSHQIGIQLFFQLDPHKELSARKCIEIADAIRRTQNLNLDGTLLLAQAYLTIQAWPALFELVEGALLRFVENGRLAAVRAFALDKLGRTPEAMAQLATLVQGANSDPVAINTYIHIVTRCGFTKEAINLVQELVSNATDKGKQRDYLRLLFQLVYQSDPHSQRAEEIAWRIGSISKQDDEVEEGTFLITYLSATISPRVSVTGNRRDEFQRRLSSFTTHFPNSKILRGASFSGNPSAKEFERITREIVGDNSERRAMQARFVSQLERGQAHIPFAWRPRYVLSNVPDVPALWEIAKRSKRDARHYHLQMVVAEWKPVETTLVTRGIPLLDLPTLLVLKDLDLFETLFGLFPKVAIGQSTLQDLQQLAQPMGGSWASQQCMDVVAALKQHFEQIIQPIAKRTAEGTPDEKHAWGEIKQLLRQGTFTLYSDDAVFRVYAEPPPSGLPAICTIDLLNAAEVRGLLTAKQVARCIGQLCDWNVIVFITPRNIVASIPNAAIGASSVSKMIDEIQADRFSGAIFEGIWNIHKNYDEVLPHGGSLLAELIQDRSNATETLAAISGVWYLKAKLRADASFVPPLRHAVYLIAIAAQGIADGCDEAFRRLWQVYLALVALEYGDRMDEKKERDAIRFAGKLVADIDDKAPKGQESKVVGPKIKLGMTKDTAPYDQFSSAYSLHRIELAKSQKSQSK
jgi:tetratricopeptide (TPR) repeat protein